eukprot:5445497-Alexandrium_andersonii.AAC.1
MHVVYATRANTHIHTHTGTRSELGFAAVLRALGFRMVMRSRGKGGWDGRAVGAGCGAWRNLSRRSWGGQGGRCGRG